VNKSINKIVNLIKVAFNNETFLLILFILISIIIRTIFLVFIRKYALFTDYITGDQVIYLDNARAFSKWNFNNITIIHPPLYSFFLAFLIKIFGERIIAILIVQFLIDGITAFLLYRLALFYVNRIYGILIGLTFCLYPSFIYMSNHLLSETLFTFLLITATFFLISAIKKRVWFRFCLSGIFFGLSSLTRAHIIGLFLLIPVALFFIIKSEWKNKIIYGLIFFIIATIVILPWSIFLYSKYHTTVIISAKFGRTLWGTHNPYGYSRYLAPFTKEGEEWPQYLNEAELDKYLTEKALRYIYENPSSLYKVGFINLWVTIKTSTLSFNIPTYLNNIISISEIITYVVIILFFICGIFYLIKNKEKTYLIFLIYIIYTLIVCFFLKGELRYRIPLMPLIILIAFYGIYKLSSMKSNRLSDITP